MKQVIRPYMSLLLFVSIVLSIFVIGQFYQQQHSLSSDEEGRIKELLLSSDDVDTSLAILHSTTLSEQTLKELSLSENPNLQEALINYDHDSSEIFVNVCKRLPDNILNEPQTTSDMNFQSLIYNIIKRSENLSDNDCVELSKIDSQLISQALLERETK